MVATIKFSPSLSFSNLDPISSTVKSALEAVFLNKSFQEGGPVAISIFTVFGQLFGGGTQYFGSEIAYSNPGKNEKPVLKRRSLDGITAIGVDEIQYGKGQQYLTLVYQINAGVRRLLFVGRDRKAKTLLRFFHDFGKERCARLKYVCSDMWKPYIKVITKKAPQALHILDRFHIVQNLGKALNKIRAEEARRMKQEGFENILTHTKYCFLKREENLPERQKMKLNEVLQYDLKSVRAYLLKKSFQLFWEYKSSYWASWFLKKWCARAMRSQLEPIKNFVRMLRKHEPLIMNWFKANKEYSNSIVEGLNRKINLVIRKSYGFRSLEVLKIALFHTMGQLPEPEFTHRFCGRP